MGHRSPFLPPRPPPAHSSPSPPPPEPNAGAREEDAHIDEGWLEAELSKSYKDITTYEDKAT